MNWMACDVEFTDEFGDWWDHLTAEGQASVRAYVKLLEEYGVALKHPYCSGVATSKHDHMRELRVQPAGGPYRILYAFDPRPTPIPLRGGDKTQNDHRVTTFAPVRGKI